MKKRVLAMIKSLLVPTIAVLIGLLFGALLMLITGNNPLRSFMYLFQGSLKTLTRASNMLGYMVPLIMTGLSITFSFKTGLFNIGVAGQMLIGGLCSIVLGLTMSFPRSVFLPAMIFASITGGVLWAFIPGFLKARFNVNEVVSGIMMNWIAYWVVYFVISDNFKSVNIETESLSIPAAASLKAAWLTKITGGSNLNLGIILAMAAVMIINFVLDKTTIGYQMKAVGFNRYAAQYGGISVARNTILAMSISGALAGLAGLTYYCGYLNNIQIGVMPSQGFDGIAVALLANVSPLGVVLSALFFAVLQTGKGFMNAMISIPPEIADIIIAVIIYFSATSALIQTKTDKIKKFFHFQKTRGA
jgi:simple sugar transport system permease protein